MVEKIQGPPAPALGGHAGLRREAACQPGASPEALARLAFDDNFWVRTAAAAHPAFPEALRRKLRRAGSSADLAAFAPPDPGLEPEALAELAAAGAWGERLAARHPAAPPALLARLAGRPGSLLRADVARHPATSPEALARLLEDGDPAVRRAAAAHPAVSPDALALLRRAGAGENLDGSGAVEASLSPAECSRLAQGGPFVRRLAARNPALAAADLERLASDPDAEVRQGVASNPACPAPVLLALAGDGEPRVVRFAAANPGAPPEALQRLAEEAEDDVEVLVAVARHPASPPALLERLAEHGAYRVREQVGAHRGYPREHRRLMQRAGSTADLLAYGEPDPGLPAQALERLARSGTWARRLAALHPSTPPPELARLAADSDLLVRSEAAGNPATPREALDLLARAGGAPHLEGLADPLSQEQPPPARSGSLSAEELASLAALGAWGRRLAARRPEARQALLADLAGDADPTVRAAVASHPATGLASLSALAEDVAAGVRWAVVRRLDAPPEVLSVLARDPLAAIRCAVAAHPAAPEELCDALARDPDEDVRDAVGRRLERISVCAPTLPIIGLLSRRDA